MTILKTFSVRIHSHHISIELLLNKVSSLIVAFLPTLIALRNWERLFHWIFIIFVFNLKGVSDISQDRFENIRDKEVITHFLDYLLLYFDYF